MNNKIWFEKACDILQDNSDTLYRIINELSKMTLEHEEIQFNCNHGCVIFKVN